jgi:hypothetical protein
MNKLTALCLALATLTACAQDTPAPDNPLVERHHIGDDTRRLLTMQARNTQAAPALPMLGSTATLSMQRYFDSYNNKIPPFFETKVGNGNASH